MKINFIDLQAQYKAYKNEIDAAIQEVISAANFIMGDEVKKLEEQLAEYIGAKYAISCASGTDALLLALMAIDIKPGDEVITTPFTFIASAEVISFLGAKPVFVDIDEKTYNISPIEIEKAITPKTKAIIPVCLYGQPADMDEINAIAKQHNIVVIEDAAQSFGAEYKGKKSCNLSEIGCTSFFPSKPLGCYGDGGAIFTNNQLLAEKMISMRAHGQTKRYYHKYIGINGRLDTIQAAVLIVKLKYLDQEIKARSIVAERYLNALKNSKLILPFIKDDRTSVFAQFSVRGQNRTELINKLKNNDIPTAIHYPMPLHLQEAYWDLGYKKGDFPISEKVSEEIFSLPMSAFISEEEQNYIIENLLKCQ